MDRRSTSLVNHLSATALLNSFDFEQIVEIIKETEKQAASLDFTAPLYKYFKSIMEKEDPDSL